MQKPSYYAKLEIEPLEYACKNGLNVYQFSVIKYITRYKDKNGIEDLKKAIHCIEELKEQIEQGNANVMNKNIKDTMTIDPYEYLYRNQIYGKEAFVIARITTYRSNHAINNLNEAMQALQKLITFEEQQQENSNATQLTTNLTDNNGHQNNKQPMEIS